MTVGLYLALLAFQFTGLKIYGPFFVSAVSAGFTQTLLPMMTAEIFKDKSWIYERLVYPISLIFASLVSSVLLQTSPEKVYLWALLTTSAGHTVLTFAKFERYTKP
jgi:hypothetical protein